MPATFVTAGTGVFTIAGQDYSCQVTSFDPRRPDAAAGGAGEKTACGDTLPEDKQTTDPTIVLGLVHDWSASGVSRALAAAVGTDVQLQVTLDDDDAAQQRSYAATVVVPDVPDTWTPGKLQRASVTFRCKTLTGPTFT